MNERHFYSYEISFYFYLGREWALWNGCIAAARMRAHPAGTLCCFLIPNLGKHLLEGLSGLRDRTSRARSSLHVSNDLLAKWHLVYYLVTHCYRFLLFQYFTQNLTLRTTLLTISHLNGYRQWGTKGSKGIKDLLSVLKSTRGCVNLARAAEASAARDGIRE